MNGLQLIDRLPKQPRYQAVPIILVTSQVPDIPSTFGSKENLFTILPKPFELKRLLASVTAATEHSEPVVSFTG